MDRIMTKNIYIASSFRHLHAVQLLTMHLKDMGFNVLDWTKKAVVPEGLTPLERRAWMDKDDNGGSVYAFCREACTTADLVIYLGESGQDAGVEIGMARASNVPILGIRGPLEAAGLMLHGSCTYWVESIQSALVIMKQFERCPRDLTHEFFNNIKY